MGLGTGVVRVEGGGALIVISPRGKGTPKYIFYDPFPGKENYLTKTFLEIPLYGRRSQTDPTPKTM